MTAANRSLLTWPATWIVHVLTACFFAAGIGLLAADYAMSEAEPEAEFDGDYVEEDGEDPAETDEGEADVATYDVRPSYEAPQMDGPGFTVSWRAPKANWRFCMRSGIAHYTLPPE